MEITEITGWEPTLLDAPRLPDSLPDNYAPNVLRSSFVVPGSIVVYGFVFYSTNASAQYLNVFDASALPADGAVPLWSWNLPANQGVGVAYQPNGRWFKSGLVLCNSSTDATKTIGSADCLADVQFNMLNPISRG